MRSRRRNHRRCLLHMANVALLMSAARGSTGCCFIYNGCHLMRSRRRNHRRCLLRVANAALLVLAAHCSARRGFLYDGNHLMLSCRRKRCRVLISTVFTGVDDLTALCTGRFLHYDTLIIFMELIAFISSIPLIASCFFDLAPNALIAAFDIIGRAFFQIQCQVEAPAVFFVTGFV